jgi:hypothetical protein
MVVEVLEETWETKVNAAHSRYACKDSWNWQRGRMEPEDERRLWVYSHIMNMAKTVTESFEGWGRLAGQ